MEAFSYKARRADGKMVSGHISAVSKEAARSRLTGRGLKPIAIKGGSVSEKKTKGFAANRGIIYRDENGTIQIRLTKDLPSTKELAVFSKQFSLMIENGIPMLQCLDMLMQQQRRVDFKDMLKEIHSAVESGANLSDSLEPYSRVFDQLYIAMVRAGEASGQLDIILKRLVSYIEKAAKIKSQIKSAMAYPIIVLLVAIGVVTILLVVVVPTFAEQFAQANAELPELTQAILSLSNGLVDNWGVIVGTIIGVISLFRAWLKSASGKKIFDTHIIRLPIIGDVLLKVAISRFCSTMSTMLSAGVAILEALTICASSSGNKRIEELILHIREEISKGRNFSEPLLESKLFPAMVSSMVAVGESTGTLDETLAKITDIYEDEVDTSIGTMTSMIEPIMIVVIASLVGLIVIGMYLPIFDMAGSVAG